MARAPSVLPHLAATVSAQRTVIEQVLARADRLDDPRVLHDLRVALRRTAAVAKLTRGFPDAGSAEPLRVASRNLRRSLSPSRTLEVAAGILGTRFRRDPRRRRPAETVSALIVPPEKARRPRKRSGDRRLSALRRAFSLRDAELARLARPFFFAPVTAADAALAKLVRARLRKKKRRLLFAGIPDETSLHPARIAAKDLRYSFEFVRHLVPGVPDLLPAFQRFQDSAGDAHDRRELIAIVERVAQRRSPALRRAARTILPVLRADADRTLRRAQTSARGLFRVLEALPVEWS
jgi:CHAD domain-containing protein